MRLQLPLPLSPMTSHFFPACPNYDDYVQFFSLRRQQQRGIVIPSAHFHTAVDNPWYEACVMAPVAPTSASPPDIKPYSSPMLDEHQSNGQAYASVSAPSEPPKKK